MDVSIQLIGESQSPINLC